MRIIPRAEWGAQYANGFGPRAVGSLDKILHHSVTVAPDLLPPFDDDYAAVRQLEAIGNARFKKGISYHAVFSPAGLIFEGVGIDRVGAQMENRNTTSMGMVFLGNYNDMSPTEEQLNAAAWYLNEGVAEGWWRLNTITWGHRDLKSTACPGNNLYAAIGEINRRADSGNGGAVTPVTPVNNPIPVPTQPTHTPAPGPRLTRDGNLWLDEDGKLGPATISRWQQIMGTPIDGSISRPKSTLIKRVQEVIASRGHSVGRYGADGDLGKATIGALQDELGTYRDGVISTPVSAMVKALQVRLNSGRF